MNLCVLMVVYVYDMMFMLLYIIISITCYNHVCSDLFAAIGILSAYNERGLIRYQCNSNKTVCKRFSTYVILMNSVSLNKSIPNTMVVIVNSVVWKRVVSLSKKKLYPYYLVLVGSRNGFIRDYTIEQK